MPLKYLAKQKSLSTVSKKAKKNHLESLERLSIDRYADTMKHSRMRLLVIAVDKVDSKQVLCHLVCSGWYALNEYNSWP